MQTESEIESTLLEKIESGIVRLENARRCLATLPSGAEALTATRELEQARRALTADVEKLTLLLRLRLELARRPEYPDRRSRPEFPQPRFA